MPVHVELPSALTGVPARIVVALGASFPMIGAHKVLAAYACLAPRVASGRFDPTHQRAVWPSTGNYCRGGVAISRILGCRGVAVLPAGMSAERFEWLQRWVAEPRGHRSHAGHGEQRQGDLRSSCAELARDPANEIVNQFSEFGNYLGHWRCTGPALGRRLRSARPDAPRGCAGRLRRGQRLLGYAGRRRLPEGEVRRADRGGRGGRMPDAAQQRLRRAQHPGHRRQARAADPQRHEHRFRDRRQRPGHRWLERGLQHGGRARVPAAAHRVSRGAARHAAVVRAFQPLQPASRRSSSPGTSASGPTTW